MEKGKLLRKMESIVGEGNVLHRHTDLLVLSTTHLCITGCPASYIQLAYGARKRGLDCEVLDLADLVDRALKPPQS